MEGSSLPQSLCPDGASGRTALLGSLLQAHRFLVPPPHPNISNPILGLLNLKGNPWGGQGVFQTGEPEHHELVE